MLSKRSASAPVLAGLMVGGCQQNQSSQTAPPAAPPTNPDAAENMRTRFSQADPNAATGVVATVLADKQYAAVSNVDVNKFTVGDTVTLLDGNFQTLAFGTVKAVVRTALHVKYDPAPNASRGPQSGDLVVRTTTGERPMMRPARATTPTPAEPAMP